MPFIDLNKGTLPVKGEEFDVTIVGSGAAGILLAVKLSEKGKKVLMIEAGHFTEDEHRQSLNNVEQTGKFLGNAVWGRKRAIGGTTIAWGGQSLPFSALDFKQRDWVPLSGWAIKLEDVTPYYGAANSFMNVDELDYEDDIFRLLGMKALPFDKNLLRYHFSKWSPQPDFRKLYEKYLDQHVTVVYNAVVTKVNTADNGTVNTVTVTNFDKQSYTMPVNKLILATGAIEASRILLLNNIATETGWVGKCFMDHPCVATGTIESSNKYKLQRYLNTHVNGGKKYSLRMSLSEGVQQKEHLLNGSANIMAVYPEDGFDPYQELKDFMRTRALPSVKNIFGNTAAYALSTKAYTVNKFIYKHNATIRLALMLEQEPLKESYVGLSDEEDVFGLKKGKIHWQLSHKTWDTAMKLTGYVADELKRMNIGNVVRYDYAKAENTDWAEHLTDVNHHMGGTRMSESANDGVVDKNLKVWGHDNMYICSTSVFPTGSHSNPTLTMMALAVRLADQLSKN
jgi:hypothetical protein